MTGVRHGIERVTARITRIRGTAGLGWFRRDSAAAMVPQTIGLEGQHNG